MVYLGRDDIRTLLEDLVCMTENQPDDEALKYQYGFTRGYLAAIHVLVQEDKDNG